MAECEKGTRQVPRIGVWRNGNGTVAAGNTAPTVLVASSLHSVCSH